MFSACVASYSYIRFIWIYFDLGQMADSKGLYYKIGLGLSYFRCYFVKVSYTYKCLLKEKLGLLKGRVAYILICLHFYTNFLLWVVFHTVNFKYQLRWKVRLSFPLYRFFSAPNYLYQTTEKQAIKSLKIYQSSMQCQQGV